MTIEVPDRLHRVHLTIQLHLIRLHDLLDGLSDIAQPHVDAGLFDPCVGRLTHCIHQRVVLGILVPREGTVDDAAIDMCPKIEFDDIIRLKDRLVAAVRGPVSRDVIDGASGRKSDAPVRILGPDQLTHLCVCVLPGRCVVCVCVGRNMPCR